MSTDSETTSEFEEALYGVCDLGHPRGVRRTETNGHLHFDMVCAQPQVHQPYRELTPAEVLSRQPNRKDSSK